ncbi:type II toxin-antitoxin system RelE family toxin [Companilactobacillus jidongensis]|uniref:type II toxin-antitoxin system RelE family toxin n=1 Tax=Companilactobacillus jidongensis TaxID=2486006 RepID=UPI000F795C2B|nr:type II toxin-antitoxin system RelE/ParE family toxin [Companilactobacillus jidongensis]
MTYALYINEDAKKQLKKMDKYQAKLILQWLYTSIDNSVDPRSHGKGLTSNLSELWRYRVGNYRIICEIEDDTLFVTAINIGHRNSIYDN